MKDVSQPRQILFQFFARIPRQQRQHFAALLAAACSGISNFFLAATSGGQHAWEQLLGRGLYAARFFLLDGAWRTKTFSRNLRDSLLISCRGLRIKTRHVNHPGEDGSHVTAANQTRRKKIAAQGIGKCGDVASSQDVMGGCDLRSSRSKLVL